MDGGFLAQWLIHWPLDQGSQWSVTNLQPEYSVITTCWQKEEEERNEYWSSQVSDKAAYYPHITQIRNLESQHGDPDHPKYYFIAISEVAAVFNYIVIISKLYHCGLLKCHRTYLEYRCIYTSY